MGQRVFRCSGGVGSTIKCEGVFGDGDGVLVTAAAFGEVLGCAG